MSTNIILIIAIHLKIVLKITKWHISFDTSKAFIPGQPPSWQGRPTFFNTAILAGVANL